jgi:hypothetical protein
MNEEKPPSCPHKEGCALFPCFSSSNSLGFWKGFFCDSRFEGCVRFQMSLRGETPPDDLLPNGKHLRKTESPPEKL